MELPDDVIEKAVNAYQRMTPEQAEQRPATETRHEEITRNFVERELSRSYEEIEADIKDSPALEALLQIPPDYDTAAEYITPKVATVLGYEYAENCFDEGIQTYGESSGFYSQNWKEPRIIPGLHSSYLYDVMEFLLQCGLDPNYARKGDYSLLQHVCHIVNGYIAADTLRLLLEHGGDPNLTHEGESLFDAIDSDVNYDMDGQLDRQRFDSLTHCWMVIIGFGGGSISGRTLLQKFQEWNLFSNHKKLFDLENLKDHRNYTVALTHNDDYNYAPVLHIIDKRTLWEVARL